MGRLGNQLFQVAATIGTATNHQRAYVFPEWPYNNWLDSPVPTGSIPDCVEYNEPNFSFNAIILDNRNWTLHGYFQSEKYFKHCEELIRSHFKLNKVAADKVMDIGANDKTVSIHVRRGDYLELQNYHPIQPISYYTNALDLVKTRTQIDRVLVFSDDIQWCKLELGISADFVYGDHDIIDMFIMASCGHHIISNSSFSWWGAWLNPAPEKIVIAPARWFGPAIPHKTRDLFPPEWIQL